MGANVATDIATDCFAETTVAAEEEEVRRLLASLFHSENFRVQTTDDIFTTEVCGALKNIVALGAGEPSNPNPNPLILSLFSHPLLSLL